MCTSFSLLPTNTPDNSLILDSEFKISNSQFKISVSDLATAVRLVHVAQIMQRKEKIKLSSKEFKA